MTIGCYDFSLCITYKKTVSVFETDIKSFNSLFISLCSYNLCSILLFQ